MRHVPRTHRNDLDWLINIVDGPNKDPGLKLKYINTKDQVADIFTKGLFTSAQWHHLVFLSGIAPSKCLIKDIPVENLSDISNEKGVAACSITVIDGGARAIGPHASPSAQHAHEHMTHDTSDPVHVSEHNGDTPQTENKIWQ